MLRMMTVVVHVFLSVPCFGEGIVITHPPSDTVGCLGGISIFICETNRSDVFDISWIIEGNTEWNEEERGTTIDLHSESAVTVSRLSITGLPINNGTLVGCIVVVSSPKAIESKVATFTVYEIPPVEDLKILDTPSYLEYPEELVTLAWNKPSCLPAEYVYNITIHNGTGMIYTNTTTDLQLSLKLSPCYNYTIGVMIIGVTFQSQYSSSVISVEKPKTDYPARDVNISNVLIEFKTNRSSFVNFDFQILNPTCPDDFLYRHITALSPPNIKLQDPDKEIDVSDKVNRTTGIGQHSVGPFNKTFIGRLSVSTEKHDNELSHMYEEFSTFHVQSLYVDQLHNGSISVTCAFAKGSLADGCAVNFILVLPAPSKMPHHSDATVHVIIMREPKNAGTATKVMIISEGEYDINAHDYIDGHTNNDSAYSLTHQFSFSATLPVKPLSPSSRGSKTRATASTIDSDTYSSTRLTPSFDSEKTNQDLTVIVSFSLGLIFLISIITFACMFVFIYKKHHTKSLLQSAQQEATNLQKSRAQPSLYTELPELTSVGVRNDPEDPYYLSRQEFLHSAPVEIASTSESSNIAPSEDYEYVCRERSSSMEEMNFQQNSTNQNDSLVMLNSKYVNINLPKQQPRPPLRDNKPVCYATIIHNEDETRQYLPTEETEQRRKDKSAPVYNRSSMLKPPCDATYGHHDKATEDHLDYTQPESTQNPSSEEESEGFTPSHPSPCIKEQKKDVEFRMINHIKAALLDEVIGMWMFFSNCFGSEGAFDSENVIEDEKDDSKSVILSEIAHPTTKHHLLEQMGDPFSRGCLKHKLTAKEKTDEGSFVPIPTEVPQDSDGEFLLSNVELIVPSSYHHPLSDMFPAKKEVTSDSTQDQHKISESWANQIFLFVLFVVVTIFLAAVTTKALFLLKASVCQNRVELSQPKKLDIIATSDIVEINIEMMYYSLSYSLLEIKTSEFIGANPMIDELRNLEELLGIIFSCSRKFQGKNELLSNKIDSKIMFIHSEEFFGIFAIRCTITFFDHELELMYDMVDSEIIVLEELTDDSKRLYCCEKHLPRFINASSKPQEKKSDLQKTVLQKHTNDKRLYYVMELMRFFLSIHKLKREIELKNDICSGIKKNLYKKQLFFHHNFSILHYLKEK